MCDSKNAFCTKFELYAEDVSAASDKGRTYDLVTRLMQQYMQKDHILYVDNYYSSPTLFTDLGERHWGVWYSAAQQEGYASKHKRDETQEPG